KQLWVPNLIRFIRIRAKYNSVGTDRNPYLKKGFKPSKGAVLAGMLYLVGLIVALRFLVIHDDPVLLAVVPAAMWGAMMAFFWFLPDSKYHQSRVRPLIHMRWTSMGRITFLSLVFNALAWVTFWTGQWAGLY